METVVAPLVAFLAGGGILQLLKLYGKKKKDDAKDISDLSYKFRKSLEDRLDKLEKENESKETQILSLVRKLAKFEAENVVLKRQVKRLQIIK